LQKLTTIGLKPIASGCTWIKGCYINADAYALQQTASLYLSYEQVNPYCFKNPVAPHIAAQEEKRTLSIQPICQHIQTIAAIKHDRMIVEGIGGLMVPLNEHDLQLDLIRSLKCSVILVVGLKLGCLNHALLTYSTLKSHKIPIKGWILNQIDSRTQCALENQETLKHYLREISYLGYLPFGTKVI
jgi:dethiobiotin synthetase